uniref:Putative monooxygenase n=1 Tax=Davidia involucrata TaxID=16924 RepID=A0A5B7C625_DAVIN
MDPNSFQVSMGCNIWKYICEGSVTVAGDAMHPMTLDLVQGGSAALEDAVVLGRHIGESFIQNGRLVSPKVGTTVERYVKERWWHVAGLITGRTYQVGCKKVFFWYKNKSPRLRNRYLRPFYRNRINGQTPDTCTDPTTHAPFKSGVQEVGSAWWMKLFKDVIFYKLIYTRIVDVYTL